jgi:hypothetical protein
MKFLDLLKNLKTAILPSGVLLFLVLFTFSCNTTEQDGFGPRKKITQGQIMRTFSKFKVVKPSNGGNFSEPSGGTVNGSPSEGNNFGGPAEGGNFARPSEGATFSGPNQGFTASVGSVGLGGGSFTIDGETYELDIVFCSGSAFNPFEGVLDAPEDATVLIGIAFEGNFLELLLSGGEDELNAQGGIGVILTDENPDGNYNVTAFDEDAELNSNEAFLFAYTIDLENSTGEEPEFAFFVSLNGGQISASGGQIDILDLEVVKFSSEGDLFEGEEASLSANLECGELIVEEGGGPNPQ